VCVLNCPEHGLPVGCPRASQFVSNCYDALTSASTWRYTSDVRMVRQLHAEDSMAHSSSCTTHQPPQGGWLPHAPHHHHERCCLLEGHPDARRVTSRRVAPRQSQSRHTQSFGTGLRRGWVDTTRPTTVGYKKGGEHAALVSIAGCCAAQAPDSRRGSAYAPAADWRV
jgi:hypothetical protein